MNKRDAEALLRAQIAEAENPSALRTKDEVARIPSVLAGGLTEDGHALWESWTHDRWARTCGKVYASEHKLGVDFNLGVDMGGEA